MLAVSSLLVVGLVGCALRQSGLANAEEFPSALLFLEEPADTQFAHTQSAILNCNVEDRPRATITWRIARTETAVNSNITGLRYVLPNGSLYFPSFPQNRFHASVHSVGYQCVAKNKLGTIVSRIAKLQAVIVRPYNVYTKDSMVMRGNTAVIKCIIPHQVRDHVRVLSWFKDNKPVVLEGKNSFMPSGDLVMTKVNDDDAVAMYHCITINVLTGERSSSNPAKLFLKDRKPIRPKMISDAFNITVLEGNTSELQCTAEGYPVPISDEYSWRKDGITIQMGNRFSRFAGGSLRIERTTFNDQGWYDCEVKSNGISAAMRVYLTVKVPLRLLMRPRRIVVPVSSLNSTMDCEVKGQPKPQITWLHNGQPISRQSRITITPNNQLSIAVIYGEDVGVYQCIADNGLELVQSSAVLITGERNPTVEASTHRKIAKRGENVSLWCKAFSQLTPEITWYLEEEQLHDGNEYSITSTSLNEGGPQAADQGLRSTLLVKSLNVEKSGKYSCIACNFGNCTAQDIHIYIDGSTSITSLPREVSGILRQELNIPCVAKGYPVPTVSWSQNGKSVPFDQRQSVQNNILSIFQLQQSDGGRYKCTAVNSKGNRDEAVVSVTILELPDPQITAVEWRQGKPGHIQCTITTTDTAITWIKDGVVVNSYSKGDTFDMIVIRNLTTADSGNYKCIARNRAGIRSVSKQMTVYVPPKFTKEPINQQVLKGDMAQLTCTVIAVPPVRIDWSKDIGGKFVTVRIDHPRFQKLLNGTLVIRNVSEEDDGKYLCTAYNTVSEQESRHVMLTVHAPATIRNPPANRPANVASDVIVTCTAIGNLPIQLIWLNGTRPMTNSSRVSITTASKHGMINSTLTVRRLVLQDTRSYSCSVINTFGRDFKVFNITAQQKPSPPLNPEVLQTLARSVYLSWTRNFDGNAKIKNYLVELKLDNSGWETGMKRRVDSGFALLVDGLKPASTYDMRVYAVNSLGRGDASTERSATTLEAAPSQPPMFSNLTSISAREIYVSWEPLPKESRNGVVRGYLLTFKQKNKSWFRSETVEGGENTRVNIKNLEPYTNYTVELQAFTRVGKSPKSQQQVRTDEDVPSRPPQSVTLTVLSSQSMLVAWRKPPSDGINGRLQGYRVYYYSTRSPNIILHQTVMRPRGENVTLKGLDKFTMYKIRVLALTRKGEGVASTEIGKTTFEDIPGAPIKIQAIPVSKREIRVLWGPPDEPNGIIRSYVLYYSKDISSPARSSSDKVMKVPVNGKTTSHSLSKLDSVTLYYFWVRASTAVGTGNASDVISQTTMEEIQANIFYDHLPVTLAKRASSAIFNCEAYGYPKPSIIWYSSGRDLRNTKKYRQLANGSLEILNVRVEDAGEYECTASNALGRKTVVRKLQVQTPPSPPTRIHFRLLASAQSVNVTWREGHNGNSPVTLFVLEYKAHGDNWKVEYIHFNVKYHVLHHIDINKDYYFRMSAVNAVGNGRPSKILRVTFKDGAPPIVREYEKETTKPSSKQRQGFYGSPTFLGVLIGVSALIVVVIVCLLLVAFRGGRISMDKVHAWRKYWKRRILGDQFPQREYNHGRSNGDRSEDSPSNNSNLADSSSSLEANRSTRGSQISLPRTNSMLRGHFAHEPIMEEEYPLPPPPAPYHSITPSRGGQIPPGEETFSDSSSDASFARPVYHKPILHDADPGGHARRYVQPENNVVYAPSVYTVQRSLNGTPGIGLLGFRGNADGGSELDTASISRAMESNENLRRLAAASRASKNAAHLQSQETVYSQSHVPSKSNPRDSIRGASRNDIRRMSMKSRGDSSLSQLTPVMKAVQNPQRRESESSQEPSPYHTGYERPRGLRDPRAYDSASSEYSSSRDELISALEFGKRHNLDKYYGIPTLETTSASSDATKSSEQDGICEFTASPRPLGDGCFAPTAIHQPQFNQNYIYMLDPRRRGLDLGAVPLRSHNSSSVV